MHESVVFSMFRVVQLSPQLILEHFITPGRNPIHLSSHSPLPMNHPPPGPWQPQIYFLSLALPILDFSYKWNPTTRGLLWLASFIDMSSRFLHVVAWLSPFLFTSCIILLWIHHIFSVHQLMDIWVISIWGLWWMLWTCLYKFLGRQAFSFLGHIPKRSITGPDGNSSV